MRKNISITLLVALGLSFNACSGGGNSSSGNSITHNGVTYKTVTSPYTAKVWLDRNLGASQVCTALDDSACYGDYYQWGRASDGHENNTSANTLDGALAINLDVGHSDFILNSTNPWDWTALSLDDNGSIREANWSKTDGTSVCPAGYRVPTITELVDETISVSTAVTTNTDIFNNFLKLPSAGTRLSSDGSLRDQGFYGTVWSSSATGSFSHFLYFYSVGAGTLNKLRTNGFSVRCLKA